MKIRTFIKIVMMLALLSFIWGCGSGGGGTQGTVKYAAKSTLSGAFRPSVKGVEITLVLPAGVTVKADASGMTLAGVVTAVAPNDVTTANGSILAKYTPASGTIPGKVKIVIARGDTPFTAGNFFTVVCDVAAGQATPSAADFSCEGLNAFDSNGAVVPASWSITAGGTTVTGGGATGGTGTPTPAQTALSAGFYDFKYSTFFTGTSLVSAYAISAVSLATDNTTLTETWKYWDGAAWSATRPSGLPAGVFNGGNDYYLTSSGWVQGVAGASDHTIVFNADGTGTLTNKFDGSTAKITVTSMDISGQALGTALANTSAALFPMNSSTLVLPAGSSRYNMTFDQLTDSYTVWDYGSVSSTISVLGDVPTVFAEGSTSQHVYIDSNTANSYFYALFGSGNSVNIYQQTFTATSSSTPALIGTATWAYKTVYGQQLLVITIPPALRATCKLGGDPLFAVVGGVVKQGEYLIGGQTSYANGGTSYNKTVADFVAANFSPTGTVAAAKAISKAILGF